MSRSGPKDVTSSSTVEEEGSKTKLERENRMLKEQIVQLHSSLESYRRALHQHHAQTKAQERGEQGDSTQNKEERDVDDLDRVTLSTGEEVFIKPEELAAIRAVFNTFDVDKKGTINANELQLLHEKLGEPISEEEAQQAVNMIEHEGAEAISFDEFLRYWSGTHDAFDTANKVAQLTLKERLKDFEGTEAEESFEGFVPKPHEDTTAIPMDTLVGTAQDEEEVVPDFTADHSTYEAEERAAAGVSAEQPQVAVPIKHSKMNDKEAKRRYRQWYASKFKFLKARINNPMTSQIITQSKGNFPSLEWRMFFYHRETVGSEPQMLSPWHDIPLHNEDGTYNFVCEIPKWTRRKMEVATDETFNPIKQDVKNGMLRNYTWGDMLFNYGLLPQTWEDPEHWSPHTAAGGDNDPLDFVELGSKQWRTGSILAVKILGVLAMVDDGETDWKIVGINVEDPYADKLNDIHDVEVHLPGALGALRRWLKYYKSPQVNSFAFGEKCQTRDYAINIVEDCHEHWKTLVKRQGQNPTV